MTRASWLLAATTIVGLVASIWLYVDNRSLRAARDDRPRGLAAPQAQLMGTVANGVTATPRFDVPPLASAPKLPVLPDPQRDETRLERRARGQQEFAAMWGRLDGETAEQYKERVAPLIKAGLAIPRTRVEEMRKAAEDKAKVTPEQSKALDRAFDKVYDDVLAYTDKAVADRQLSPYERNVSGWLEYAGGLGTILNDAQGQMGKVLSPDQMRTMSESGFEWAEFLALEMPWERLQAPPAPR